MSKIGTFTEQVKEIGTYSSGADTEIGAVDNSFIVLQSYASKVSPSPATYNGTSDWYSYVVCLDNSDKEKWVKQFGSFSTNVAISDIDGNGEKEIIVWISNEVGESGGVFILNSATGNIIHNFSTNYGLISP